MNLALPETVPRSGRSRSAARGLGRTGPRLRAFAYFHTTYCADIKFNDGAGRLLLLDGLVYYDGLFYGDWSVFDGPLDEEEQQRLVTFEMEKAQLPDEYRPAMH